jgi:hypothetical protein
MHCIGCGEAAVQLHHVVYRQHLRRAGGDPSERVGMVPVCLPCHAGQHGTHPLLLVTLPDTAIDWAVATLGPGPAYNYLRRHYAGPDPRLMALL